MNINQAIKPMADLAALRHDSPPMQTAPNQTGLAYRLSELARKPGLHVYICRSLRTYRTLSEELSFFLQDNKLLLWRFPAWEVLPYDRVSPHHAIVGDRFATLARLIREPSPQGLVLTVLPAFLHRIAPPEVIAAHVWQLKVGGTLDISRLKERLALAGMQSADRVLVQGEFAARGGILDIWPATEETPLRLDLFGDEIESIRRFDPETQRSGEALEAFISVPVREVILDELGIERFTAAFRSRFPQLRKHPMLASVLAGRPHPGIESLLPLTYERTARLPDYLPDGAEVLADGDINDERGRFTEQVRSQFEMVRFSEDPIISPQELFAVETNISAAPLPANVRISPAPQIADFQAGKRPLHALLDKLSGQIKQGYRLMLVAHGPGQQERMLEACAEIGEETAHCQGLHDLGIEPISTTIGFLDAGFMLEDERLIVLTGRELIGQRLPRRRARGAASIRADVFGSLQELQVNDPVVHEDHGVGRYLGLTSMEAGGTHADFLHIEYASETSIYMPVEELDRLHRYTGSDKPQLNKLGTEKWKRTRTRVQRDLLAMANELIAIDAVRRQHKRPPYTLQGETLAAYEEFVARFPFEETDDQAEAIDAVLRDLAMDTVMDRVVCGDVGFGKTEVAMRATFTVAQGNRQIAVLAPTTVLANQHFSTFSERFAGTNISVAMLSRLQGKKEADRVLAGLKSGDINIVIGTHRLLVDDIAFADLGLVVVDEEHRFGVRHKERLKSLYHSTDLLTLTATPIPRTLHQTLSGLRSVSIISTPPAEREAIRTMVSTFDENLAHEAIRRELYRGGQIYYLHNHVGSIERIAKRLAQGVPEAEIGIAHGQMRPVELDRQMLAFYEGRLHILVCTTIIESGLDVPNANTLIVERADMLGLAQLHQIRGRVGRSHQQAYAYLFTPDPHVMTRDAHERLDAIARHNELGAGFLLARHDMEIRGAGNLLGEQQSGQIESIGLDLYMDMLRDAVDEVNGMPPKPQQPLDIRLHVNAILPPDYIPQVGERLSLYRRIAKIASDDDINALFDELTDRFGKMPDEARFSLETARIRWRARNLGLKRLNADNAGIRLLLAEDSPVDIARLLQHVQKQPSRFRLTPDGNLILLEEEDDPWLRLKACSGFLDELLEECT